MQSTEDILDQYKPMLAKISRKYAKPHIPMEDLMQVGSVGILEALGTFNPTQGAKLSTWIYARISGHILRYLRDKSRMVRGPRNGPTPGIKPIDDYALTLASDPVDHDTSLLLQQILGQMPCRLSQVMWLHDGCGKSGLEVALLIETSESTVFNRLYKARKLARAIGAKIANC
jgi:RNA polymerase sigma factor (sigma-70 family)